MRWALAFLGLLVCVVAGSGAGQAQGVVWRPGDDPAWSAPGLDVSDWSPISTLPDRPAGVFWIRAPLLLAPEATQAGQLSITVEAQGAYEVYFDGRLIARSGRLPAGDDAGQAGDGLARFGLPAGPAGPGAHVIAIRGGAEMLARDEAFSIVYQLDDMAGQVRRQRQLDWIDGAAGFSAFFLCLAFMGLRYWRPERLDTAFAAAMCACLLAIVVLNPETRPFSPAWLPVNLTGAALAMVSLALFCLIPLLVGYRLRVKPRWVWALAVAAAFAVSFMPLGSLQHDARAFAALMLLVALMSLYAWPRGPVTALAHAGAALLALAAILLEPQFLTGFLALVAAFLSVSLILELMQGEMGARRREARIARLQSDLVRRNIQPHFIMNSLTVASEFQETDPAAARRFVSAMAAEFAALSAIIDEPHVRLAQELELCRSHLDMMGLRLDRRFTLKTSGVDEFVEFPPGVLHTLLENAISHNRYDRDVVFTLTAKREGRQRIYRLTTPLGRKKTGSAASSGSGQRYVESRLEEFAPGRWSLNGGESDGAWVTEITIPAEAAPEEAI